MISSEEQKAPGARAKGGRGKTALIMIPPALLVVALALVLAFRKSPEAKPTETPPVNVKVMTIVPVAALPDEFDIPGVVEPRRVVHVSAEVACRVEEILVAEGQPCKQGDVMVRLNTDLLGAAYARARATAEFDARDYERILDLSKRGVATSTEVDQVRSRAEASQAAMEQAKAELDRATIVAPIDGVINAIPIEVGEYVQAGTMVVEIVDADVVKVVVDVPERDLPFLSVGQKNKITLNRGSEPVTGEITYISKLADEATRTTPVELTVDNADGRLHSGQIVVARLLRRVLTDAVMIPLGAVIPLEDGYEVYVVEEGKAVSRRVTLGVLKGTDVQITSGLAAGDELIVEGHRYVGPGQSVNVVGRVGGGDGE